MAQRDRIPRDPATNRVTAIVEERDLPANAPAAHECNAGVYVFSREFFALLPDKGDHETTALPAVTALFKLFGLKSHAYWRPVDSIKDISEAEKELAGLATK